MIEIKNCPSSLAEGFNTYSPKYAKLLFGKTKVNPVLGFDIDEFRNVRRDCGCHAPHIGFRRSGKISGYYKCRCNQYSRRQ